MNDLTGPGNDGRLDPAQEGMDGIDGSQRTDKAVIIIIGDLRLAFSPIFLIMIAFLLSCPLVPILF